MRNNISITVITRKEFAARVGRKFGAATAAVKKVMSREMALVAMYVKERKLSGEVLKNRTGTLRRSIHHRVDEGRSEIVGTVGTRVRYARPHEEGGAFQIPAHTRTQTHAWGRPILPRPVTVRAHSATFPQRAFLRPSLETMRGGIKDSIRGALSKALDD